MIGGHGHVKPRPDGMKVRCGGPGICKECALELAQMQSITPSIPDIAAAAMPAPRMGCICPPGANKDCENPLCPRKNPARAL